MNFESTLGRIRQNWEQIEAKFEQMESRILVDLSFTQAQNSITLDDLIALLVTAREEEEIELVADYEGIPPLLNKIEEAVSTHNTGSDPNLRQLYSSVEMRVFLSLRTSILNSLKKLQEVTYFFTSNPTSMLSFFSLKYLDTTSDFPRETIMNLLTCRVSNIV